MIDELGYTTDNTHMWFTKRGNFIMRENDDMSV